MSLTSRESSGSNMKQLPPVVASMCQCQLPRKCQLPSCLQRRGDQESSARSSEGFEDLPRGSKFEVPTIPTHWLVFLLFTYWVLWQCSLIKSFPNLTCLSLLFFDDEYSLDQECRAVSFHSAVFTQKWMGPWCVILPLWSEWLELVMGQLGQKTKVVWTTKLQQYMD